MKYYSISRPLGIGVLSPSVSVKTINVINFDCRLFCDDIQRESWGYIETDSELTQNEIDQCELLPENAAQSEHEKRIKVAYLLVGSGYSKKEAYQESMHMCMEEIEAILEE